MLEIALEYLTFLILQQPKWRYYLRIKSDINYTHGFLHNIVEYSTLLEHVRKPLCIRPHIFSCKIKTDIVLATNKRVQPKVA